jgi:O-antigen ligase
MQAVGSVERSPLSQGLLPALFLGLLALLMGVGMAVVGPMTVLPIFGVLFFALIVARPEYGIALFMSAFLISYPQALRGSGVLTINNVLGGLFLILLTYKVYSEHDWWFLRCRELQLLAFIFVVFIVAGRFNAPDRRLMPVLGGPVAIPESSRTFLTRSVFTVFFVNYIRTPAQVVMIYLLVTVLMVLAALSGVREVLHGGGLHGYRAVSGVILAAANPNRLAMFAIMPIAGLWYLTRSLRVPALLVFVLPLIAVLALAVFMTGSRSGLLGLGVCGAAILIKERLDLTQLFTLALAGMLVLVLVLQLVPQKTLVRITNLPFTQAGETGLGASSFARREYTWKVALKMFKQHPFIGVGIGNWPLARYLNDPARATGSPHSSYILALVEGGLLSLGGFLYLLWLTWRNVRVSLAYVTRPDSPLANLRWIVHSIEVDLLVLVFFSAFADLWQFVTLFLLVGLSIVIRRMVEQRVLEEAVYAEP